MQFLIPVHILAGSVALISAAIAIFALKGRRVHILAGRTYFGSMLCIFLTSIPMSVISGNIFLFLIVIFSFYMAFSGMRFARNKKGIATPVDWIAIGLMLISGVGMFALSVDFFLNDNSKYIVLLVFGFLAVTLAYQDAKTYKAQSSYRKQRISRHLSNMMGGTIAVITALLVVNVHIEPLWIWWVLPTIGKRTPSYPLHLVS